MKFSLFTFAPEKLVSRDRFGHSGPRQPAHSPYSLNLVPTHRIPPDFRSDVHFFIPPSAIGSVPSLSGNAILRIDGVHCRESAATGPIVLKVVPVTGAAFSGFTLWTNSCAPLFSHTHCWYEVSMCDTRFLPNNILHLLLSTLFSYKLELCSHPGNVLTIFPLSFIFSRSNHPRTSGTCPRQDDVFGYEQQLLLPGVLPVFQNMSLKKNQTTPRPSELLRLQRRLAVMCLLPTGIYLPKSSKKVIQNVSAQHEK